MSNVLQTAIHGNNFWLSRCCKSNRWFIFNTTNMLEVKFICDIWFLNIFSIEILYVSFAYLDPTSFTGIRYLTQENTNMFDGRCSVNNFRDYYAYVFEASYSDHSSVKFRCNPEFGRSEATRVATHYATALGRIPEVFRSRVDIFDLNRGKLIGFLKKIN